MQKFIFYTVAYSCYMWDWVDVWDVGKSKIQVKCWSKILMMIKEA